MPTYRYALDGTGCASFADAFVSATSVDRTLGVCKTLASRHFTFSYVDDDLVPLPFGAAFGTNDGADFLLTSFVNLSLRIHGG